MTKTEKFLELDIKLEQDIEAYKLNYAQGIAFIYAKVLKRMRRTIKAERPSLDSVRKRKEVIKDLHEDIDLFSREIVESSRKELSSFAPVYYDKVKTIAIKSGGETDYANTPKFNNSFMNAPVALNDGRAVSIITMMSVVNRIMKEDVITLVNRAAVTNESDEQIGQYINASGNRVRNQIDIVGATAVAIVTSLVKGRFFNDNKRMFRGHQHVSILDGKTSDICIYRAGKTWIYDDKKASTLPDADIPPLHFKCRSFLIPIFVGDNSVNEPSYSEWLERQPEAIQKEILGPTRFGLYRRGDVTVGQMFESPGRRLTLRELRQTT